VSRAFCSAVVVISVILRDKAMITAMPSVISIYMWFLSCKVENLPRVKGIGHRLTCKRPREILLVIF
jgi:hypothetical protein